jgi:competence protein ComEA
MKRNTAVGICKLVVIMSVVSLFLGAIAFAEQGAGLSGEAVNINIATVKELAALPGIGKMKAEAIVAYRQENGRFNTVDDIKKIEGIGKKTFNKIREQVVVE